MLPVRPGLTDAFEAAFAEAYPLIASMPGFRGLSLSKGIERPQDYLLLVRWDALTDHTEGFRGSPEYQRWRGLLHHFYDPIPQVDHFAPIVGDDVVSE